MRFDCPGAALSRWTRPEAMDVLLYLIPIALFLGFLGLVGFIWALRSGQYDDPEGAAERILFDEENEE